MCLHAFFRVRLCVHAHVCLCVSNFFYIFRALIGYIAALSKTRMDVPPSFRDLASVAEKHFEKDFLDIESKK